jgi:hypothetical protein
LLHLYVTIQDIAEMTLKMQRKKTGQRIGDDKLLPPDISALARRAARAAGIHA